MADWLAGNPTHYSDGRTSIAGRVSPGHRALLHESLTREALAIMNAANDNDVPPVDVQRPILDPPFVDVPRAEARDARWVEPALVAEVEFTAWTRDGHLPHPSFKGLREDKDPREVRAERPRG
jgi:hypothetical protein